MSESVTSVYAAKRLSPTVIGFPGYGVNRSSYRDSKFIAQGQQVTVSYRDEERKTTQLFVILSWNRLQTSLLNYLLMQWHAILQCIAGTATSAEKFRNDSVLRLTGSSSDQQSTNATTGVILCLDF
jgi:hypothetical protein